MRMVSAGWPLAHGRGAQGSCSLHPPWCPAWPSSLAFEAAGAASRKGCPCHLSLAWSKGVNLRQQRLQGMDLGRDGGRCDLPLPHTVSQSLARQQRDMSRRHIICSWSLLLPFLERNRSLVPGND